MDFSHQLVFGTTLLELIVSAEVAHFHHVTVETLRRATARGVIEGHLRHRETEMFHHEISEDLPWFHQMHA